MEQGEKGAVWKRLRRAACRGDLEVLMELRGKWDCCDGHGFTAVHEAAQAGQLECLNLLLSEGRHVDVCDKQGWTPCIVAAAAGHARVVERLLQLGADVSARTLYGRCALHAASAKGRLECVVVLLKKGADIKAVDDAGMTPLHLAALHGHLPVCARLATKKNAKILLDIKNAIGDTPIEYQDQQTFWAHVAKDQQQQQKKQRKLK